MATQKDFKVKNGLVVGGPITVGSTEIINDSGKVASTALTTVDTDDVSEGSTNQYFTDARAVTAIKADADWNASDWDTAYGWGDHSTAGYLTSFTETNDLSAAVTWANVPDANITQSSVTQHQAALSITESQISDFGSYETAFSKNTAFNKNFGTAAGTVAQGNDSRILNGQTAFGWGDHSTEGYLTSYTVTQEDVTQHQAALSITESQISDFGTYNNYTDTDVASYLSTNGYATQSTIVAAITDSAPATLDTLNELAAALGDDANFSTTITNSIATKWTQDNTKISNWDTAYGWGDHSAAGYLTAETNDLSSVVTWANVPDANITQSSVTQHQGALSITESQISDFGDYEPEGNALALAIALG